MIKLKIIMKSCKLIFFLLLGTVIINLAVADDEPAGDEDYADEEYDYDETEAPATQAPATTTTTTVKPVKTTRKARTGVNLPRNPSNNVRTIKNNQRVLRQPLVKKAPNRSTQTRNTPLRTASARNNRVNVRNNRAAVKNNNRRRA